jgi:ribosome biogenesis SPOUT family RNA methylase Rps3
MVRCTKFVTVLWRNQMQVEMIEEHEDGSATVVLKDIEPRMVQLLLQEGLVSLLSKEIARLEKEDKIPALLKGKPSEL